MEEHEECEDLASGASRKPRKRNNRGGGGWEMMRAGESSQQLARQISETRAEVEEDERKRRGWEQRQESLYPTYCIGGQSESYSLASFCIVSKPRSFMLVLEASRLKTKTPWFPCTIRECLPTCGN